MKSKKKNQHGRTGSKNSAAHVKQPFVEHLHELRRRFYIIAVSILLWGCAAYSIQQSIVAALLKPAKGQDFIYTSPGGGIDFLFRICIYAGIAVSVPLIVYQILGFFGPIMEDGAKRFARWASIWSGLLALAGMAFGYFIGLPAALHFLLHQFTTIQIKPLVTIQSYLGFVLAYMLGSALLFQLPIILLFINRIKPLQPKQLIHYERWVILAAFVLSGLMNPSPNIVSQLIVAVPFIVMYQVGILFIAMVNRRHQKMVFEPIANPDVVAEFESRAPVRPADRPQFGRVGTFMDIRPAANRQPIQRPRPTQTALQIRRQQRFFDFIPPEAIQQQQA